MATKKHHLDRAEHGLTAVITAITSQNEYQHGEGNWDTVPSLTRSYGHLLAARKRRVRLFFLRM